MIVCMALSLMNAMDKYVISFYYGKSLNGLYAVSHKIPTILNTFNIIFFQAWQLSAIEEVKSKDRKEYYASVFRYLSTFMLWVTSAIMFILRPLYAVWVAPEYYDAWKCTPILLFATLFMCFSSFWGSNFIALKKTGGILKSAEIGAALNLALNFLLIPRFELYGAAAATMVGFLATWLVRVWDSRKEITVSLDLKFAVFATLIIVAQIPLLHTRYYMLYETAAFVAVTAMCFFSMREMLASLIKKLGSKLRSRNKGK